MFVDGLTVGDILISILELLRCLEKFVQFLLAGSNIMWIIDGDSGNSMIFQA